MKKGSILTLLIIGLLFFINDTADSADLQYVQLTRGWNFISIPKQPPDVSPDAVLRDISGDVRIVWGYDNLTKEWLQWKPSGTKNRLTNIEPAKGYWIYVDKDVLIDISNCKAPSQNKVSLYDDWNLIGYTGDSNIYLPAALSGIRGKWVVVWTWDKGQWSAIHETPSALTTPLSFPRYFQTPCTKYKP